MKRVQEVSDNVFNEIKKFMTEEATEFEGEPTFDEIFDVAVDVEDMLKNHGYDSISKAYSDLCW